ncbi:MAG: hypothetical protein OXQ99_00485 [Chloroflexota bacterium]|nr:hypothetical protein [Chloroflexota bacterium]
MRLIAITGMRHQPKARFTRALVDLLSPETDRLALIDNSDAPLAMAGVRRQRLAGGCVCCSLATALISHLGRLDADYALLPVSALADPEALASILDSLRSERIQIATVSLIDNLTQIRNPYLTRKLESYSDIQVHEPFDMSEAAHAAIGAPL